MIQSDCHTFATQPAASPSGHRLSPNYANLLSYIKVA